MTRDRDSSDPRPLTVPSSSPPNEPSATRGRAVRHLRRILLTSAATSAAIGLTSACGSDVEDRGTGGVGVGGATATGGGPVGGLGGIGQGGTPGSGGEGGDVVCDPMPDPLVCTGDPDTAYFQEFAYWSAEWQQSGADLVVHVTIQTYAYSPDTLEFSADPNASNATVQDVVRQATQLELDLLPDAEATEVVVTVPLDCNGTTEQLVLSVDVSPTGAPGESVPITPAE